MTKEKFNSYLFVQRSGETNMWNVDKVIELANESALAESEFLTEDDCLDIMKNYAKYKKEYAE